MYAGRGEMRTIVADIESVLISVSPLIDERSVSLSALHIAPALFRRIQSAPVAFQRPIDPFGRVRGVNHLANLQPDSRSGGLHRRIFRPAFNPFRDILFNPRNHIRRDAMVLRELTSPLQTPDGRP